MTWVVGFIACWIWPKVESLKGPPPTVNQLVELNEIIYPESNYDFPRLKQEVQRLKSLRLKELESQLETKKKTINKFYKTKLARIIMDLYLQSHAQMIAQNKDDDAYAQNSIN